MRKKSQGLTVETNTKGNIANQLKNQFAEVNFYHGSTSSSLMYLNSNVFKTCFGTKILVRTEELIEKEFVVFSGELGNVFDEKSANRKGISGCDPANAMGAGTWAKQMANAKWSKEKVEKIIEELKQQIPNSDLQENQKIFNAIDATKKRKMNLENQLKMYDQLTNNQKSLISDLFPVVYACKIDTSKIEIRKSDVGTSELIAKDGCAIEEIQAIFVPNNKKELTSFFLPDELKNKVFSFEEYFDLKPNSQATFQLPQNPKDEESKRASFSFT